MNEAETHEANELEHIDGDTLIVPPAELTELELVRWYNARLTRLLTSARERLRELEQAPTVKPTDGEHETIQSLRADLAQAEKEYRESKNRQMAEEFGI